MRWLALVLLAVCAALVFWTRIRLAGLPIERDEGEYAYMGWLILEGVPPYVEAANMKWPGTYYSYALMMAVFGRSEIGIRLGLLLVVFATSALLFLMGRRMFGGVAGAAAAVAHLVLTVDPVMLGLAGHASHFVMLFAVAGAALLQTSDARWTSLRLLGAGACLGLAMLMKQSGVFFSLLAFAWVWWRGRRERAGARALLIRLALLGSGVAAPLVAALTGIIAAGAWSQFRLWTVDYAGAYATLVPLREGLLQGWTMTREVVRSAPGLWLAALLGLAAVLRVSELRPWRAFLAGFVVASAAAVCPGLYFRGHYYLHLVPAAALLVGAAVEGGRSIIVRRTGKATLGDLLAPAVAAAATLQVGLLWSPLLTDTPDEVSRTLFGHHPFGVSPDVAQFIRERTREDERIAVVGSEPQIYFLAGRRAATGYLYTYPLIEEHRMAARMRDEFRQQIDAAHPRYVVFASVHTSWLTHAGSDRSVFQWFEAYARKELQLVGLVHLTPLQPPRLYFDDRGVPFRNAGGDWIGVFRRREPE